MVDYTIVIPARLNSSRLPNKLMLDQTGQPLLQYTIGAALGSPRARVIVASSDKPILDLATRLKVECVETAECNSGTERVIWTAKELNLDGVIVNWQGDEPELSHFVVDRLVDFTIADDSPIGTLKTNATTEEAFDNDVVKVVCTIDNRALYFSRLAIPFGGPYYKHIGIYCFNDCVCDLEKLQNHFENERLEQSAWLANGYDIGVMECVAKGAGINTARDYMDFVERAKSGLKSVKLEVDR